MNAEQLAALLEVTRLLAAEVSLDVLLELILQTSRQVVDADRSTLYRLTGDGATLESQFAVDVEGTVITLPYGRGVAGHVATTGEVVNLPDAYADPRFDRSVDQALGYRTRSMLTVPMRNRQGVIIGVLQVVNKHGGVFTREDEELLLALASSASIAIENARLYEEVRHRERMNRDLEIAHAIQMGLLPTSLPSLPAVEFAASCKPALAIGGDFYDFSPLRDDAILLAVVDVSGKGVAAGLIMAMVRIAIRSEAFRARSLAELLFYCNRGLYNDLSNTNMFATAFAVIIDRDGKLLRYANAGHWPALLYRGQSGKVEPLDAEGMPLGILPDTVFEDKQVPLEPGDAVVIYTDGFTEAVGPGTPARRYSLELFTADVQRHGHLSADDLRRALIAQVARFTAAMPQADDQTILVIKVRAGDACQSGGV